MSVYKLKIKTEENSSRVISLMRKFDSAISIGEIRKRIAEEFEAMKKVVTGVQPFLLPQKDDWL